MNSGHSPSLGGVLPPETVRRGAIHFHLPAETLPFVIRLPWDLPLETWEEHGVQFLHVRSGLSRHIVRFVGSGPHRYAVKETTPETAQEEFENYTTLRRLGIPTLVPVGVVLREEGTRVVATKVGTQVERRSTGYLVTEVMQKVIPDSYLFRRAFSQQSRRRIWDAIVTLFVQLHGNRVYWGDASLANMLIEFMTEPVPELGSRTKLCAVCADAETVEIRRTISDRLRMADVEFFLESMLWTEADLQASGVVRDPLVTRKDQEYLVTSYAERFSIDQEMRSFELLTHIDVDKVLGSFDARGLGKVLLQHIGEHKWYLSERRGAEVQLVEAAEDWYKEVFKPVCRIFSEHGLLKFFPDKTASTLYVEVMEHKYYLSELEKRDVGLVVALKDYLNKFAAHDPIRSIVSAIIEAVASLFARHKSSQNIYLS